MYQCMFNFYIVIFYAYSNYLLPIVILYYIFLIIQCVDDLLMMV